MSIHNGHRQRLKDRFLREGLDGFEEHNVLELMLFYCIPRKDTNPIAHELLNRFGSLAKVFDAPVEELVKVPGLGMNAALFLSMQTALTRRYLMSKEQDIEILMTIEDCGRYLIPRFFGRPVETVFLLCLDAKCKVLSCKEVGEGSVNYTHVPIQRIVKTALSANATTVILAHNHPSGMAVPSVEDEQTTYSVAKALAAVEIILMDHLIISDGDFVSLAQSGKYNPNLYPSLL